MAKGLVRVFVHEFIEELALAALVLLQELGHLGHLGGVNGLEGKTIARKAEGSEERHKNRRHTA